VNAIAARLITPAVRYSQPGLQSHIQYLYDLTSGADQKVGRDAVARYGVLRQQLDAILAEVRSVLGADALPRPMTSTSTPAPAADDDEESEEES
jgi:hypothetical protein